MAQTLLAFGDKEIDNNLCKYIQKIILYMILTGKRYLEPDIWPKTADKVESIEDMMRKVWAKKIHCR